MKKTMIAAALAIVTLFSVNLQAMSISNDDEVKTEQQQDEKKDKDSKKCKKDKKMRNKHAERRNLRVNKMRHGHHIDLFEDIEMTQEQHSRIEAARNEVRTYERRQEMQIRKECRKRMDDKVKEILTPEQYSVYTQNVQKRDSVKMQHKKHQMYRPEKVKIEEKK